MGPATLQCKRFVWILERLNILILNVDPFVFHEVGRLKNGPTPFVDKNPLFYGKLDFSPKILSY